MCYVEKGKCYHVRVLTSTTDVCYLKIPHI